MSHKDLIEALNQEVFQKYKAVLLKEEADKKEIDKALHSIKIELAAIDEDYTNNTRRIASYADAIIQIANPKKSSTLLPDFEKAFLELKNAIDGLFGKVLELSSSLEPIDTRPAVVVKKYFPTSNAELKELVQNEEILLDEIDVSGVKNFRYIFSNLENPYLDEEDEEDEDMDFSGIAALLGADQAREMQANLRRMQTGAQEQAAQLRKSSVRSGCAWFSKEEVFTCKDFSGIETWDVSQAMRMDCMFAGAIHFNGDISGWDVSGVTDMSGMFAITPSLTSP
ncbi:BspA family leucine-rich repeat surface protein [Helicobacter heilmannii]|uniref:BspA family leucine-rich repeat surface protein n=1 Tax=Helicobacter heilmannii TaxID=35817 RepID=UPI0012E161CE|nr:BspA family leucine-rich repeat surface protein [Helicobacter heilmannii]